MPKKISIRGPIISSDHQWIYDLFEMDAISPKKFADELGKVTDGEVELEINSGGGSVYAASEMYTMLKDSGYKTVGKILGMAASAASFLATGCNRLLISPTAQMMVHNATSWQEGDYQAMDHASEFLKNVNKSIMNAYHLKSKQPFDKLKELMDKETFLTAEQAKELNFVDEIMFVDGNTPLNSISLENGMIPAELINKMMNKSSELKGLGVQNNLLINQNSETNVKNTQEEENTLMTLEELKNNHPDLYEQVYNFGLEDGKKAENSRIKEIEDLAIPGMDNLVNDAKFKKNQTAAQLAVEIIKNQKAQGANYLQNIKIDTEVVNNLGNPQDDSINQLDNKDNKVDNEVAKLIADNIKKARGE